MALIRMGVFLCLSAALGCGSSPGMGMDADVGVEDDGVTILTPDDGAFLSNAQVQVTGQVGEMAGEVTVNGEVATLDGSEFMVDLLLREGVNTITATTASGKRDEISVTVDSEAPVLVIDTPKPGSWIEGSVLQVEGKATDANLRSLHIGETLVEVNSDGSFSATLTPTAGAVRLRAVAEDETGRKATAFVSAILGAFEDPDNLVPAGIALNLGDDALSEFPKAITPFLGSDRLRPLLLASNPAATGRAGIFRYEVTLTDESHDSATVALEADAEGLNATVTFENITIPFDVEVSNFPDFSGTARASAPKGVAQFRLGTADDRLVVFPRNIDVMLGDDFVVDINNVPNWLDRNVVTRAIRGKLEAQIESLIADQVGPILQDLLARIDSAYFFDVLTRRVRVSGDVASASTSDAGVANVTVNMGVFLSGDELPELVENSKGSLVFNEPPVVETGDDASLYVSMDMINAALYQVWSKGELNIEIPNPQLMPGQPLTAAVLSIFASKIGQVVDPSTPISVSVSAVLPPVFTRGEDELDGEPVVQLADLRVSFYATVDGERVEITTVSIGATGPLVVTETDGEINASVGEVIAFTDQMPDTPDIGLSVGPRLDEAATSLIEPIVADLTEFGGIKIPTIRDFTIRETRFEFVPGYLVLRGQVRHTP